jgi:hypothetical protein
MRGLRTLLAAILAVGMLASSATSVSANDTPNVDEVIPPGPGMAELRQAIDEFRAAIADLRDACRAEREQQWLDVTTARKRPAKPEVTECEKTLKALKAEFQTIKQRALELESAYRADVITKRQDDARAVAKAKEDAAKQKLEQAQKDAQQKAAANKPAPTAKPQVSAADELAKKRAKLEGQLKDVDATIAYKQGLWKQSADAAAEYRAKAVLLTGADKERYLAKAAQADKDAAQWASYVKDYTAQHNELVAALAKLDTVASPTPKPDDAAYKKLKLEQALADLDDKIAYKWSESDRNATLASDLRNQAASATSEELRNKLLAKAVEADKAADQWADLARQYEDQRDQIQAQLDALTTLKT